MHPMEYYSRIFRSATIFFYSEQRAISVIYEHTNDDYFQCIRVIDAVTVNRIEQQQQQNYIVTSAIIRKYCVEKYYYCVLYINANCIQFIWFQPIKVY